MRAQNKLTSKVYNFLVSISCFVLCYCFANRHFESYLVVEWIAFWI